MSFKFRMDPVSLLVAADLYGVDFLEYVGMMIFSYGV
jgi:hypothetical protein